MLYSVSKFCDIIQEKFGNILKKNTHSKMGDFLRKQIDDKKLKALEQRDDYIKDIRKDTAQYTDQILFSNLKQLAESINVKLAKSDVQSFAEKYKQSKNKRTDPGYSR